jgi:hypothetical protein
MMQDVGETLEFSRLELLRRASTRCDLEAWAAFQHGLEETVLTWFHEHPGSEVASRVQSESYFVALAFERLWQTAVQEHVLFETLARVLMYLRASLNGAILETLRACSYPSTISEPYKVWNWLQVQLTSKRERRLAYLLYHCGLKPTEIVQGFPQEWSDVREVARLRCIIFERLTKGLICDGHSWV